MSGNTLHELFELQVEQNSRQTAVSFADQKISYQGLNQKANQLAHYLQEHSVTVDQPIALCMERSIEFFVAILAILKAGGAYIPLDPSFPEERLLMILNEANTTILITNSKWEKKLHRYNGKLINIENPSVWAEKSKDNPHNLTSAKNLAYIIYTSGSTGKPKGVMVEHGGVINYAQWFANYCDLHTKERIDFSSNPAFDFALTTSIIPLVLGLTVVICEDNIKKDPRQYLKFLQSSRVNFIKLTPSYFRVLVHEAKNHQMSLKQLKKIMLAGENLAKSDCQAWLNLYPVHILYNEYGPTETSVAVCLFKVDCNNIQSLGSNVPIGELVPNSQAYILDEELNPVADGNIGELFLTGECLARGYLNSPELTAKSFIKNPFNQEPNARLYKTGDLCRRLMKGEIECVGRIDHQIKIRGFRVEPAEVEERLAAHPLIKAAVVIAVDGLHSDKRLIAYYIPNDETLSLNERELKDYLKQYLPDYMIPGNFVEMQHFPLNANEKLDRFALIVPPISSGENYIAPRNHLEEQLAKIWASELGIESVGIHDDFFDLGGHSLLAARIISTINHSLKKEITLQQFYEFPTIAALSHLLKSVKKSEPFLPPDPHNESDLLPLGDFQLLLWLTNTFKPKARKLNICARRRFAGAIDVQKLNLALKRLLDKHEVLSFGIYSWIPAQYTRKELTFKIDEIDLRHLPETEHEATLEHSFDALIRFYPWPKNHPLLKVQLFRLEDNLSELQIALPHIISDDVSPSIIFSELSDFYLSSPTSPPLPDTAYRHYILAEKDLVEKQINQDLDFWENYLQDAYLVQFPSEHIVDHMKQAKLPYSTYCEIPKDALGHLRTFCSRNHLSLDDGLIGILALALRNCCKFSFKDNSAIVLNKIRSTRIDPKYDETIGCFLNLALLRLAVHEQSTLISVCQQAHHSTQTTSLHQACPNLIKLASVGTFRKRRKIMIEFGIKILSWIYGSFRSLKLHRQIIKCCSRLNNVRNNEFLINVNVHSSFWTQDSAEKYWFGFKAKQPRLYQFDLLNIDNVFDVCFLKSTENKPYIAISANLTSDFRESIIKEMIRIMNCETLEQTPQKDSFTILS
ncbi:non-ribosomal peptide synthetase [Legionella jordanis]|uniref:Non-ribosomal peptide synthetase n=1 Tax=Legionella jordanis TaxID=456 RepID=A0A0W0V7K3_9GAMM|nr:amino acid adenylation domain-containing protein [Legionella jordanis]KTD16088.1 non-ribosomal peptide synthetase [Legionella jordanis]RMX04680.1 non-ribosomal peptide synthetase [Legionella jordanis]RMX18389.1 non-ribosomal peptide synthetase [Legionella jordanis]VEH12452.1 non-ribosomal peptide synthetase [Legionella jordanis]